MVGSILARPDARGRGSGGVTPGDAEVPAAAWPLHLRAASAVMVVALTLLGVVGAVG